MRITGPSSVRIFHIAGCALAVLAVLGVAQLVRAAEETPFSTLAKLATAFSENDPDAALELFDKQAPGYGDIESKIEALTAQAEISCSLDVVTDTESDGVHKLDVDWLFQLKSQADESLMERRRQRVAIEMRLIKNHWKVTALTPVTILDPLKIH
jgi:hypothetical protein